MPKEIPSPSASANTVSPRDDPSTFTAPAAILDGGHIRRLSKEVVASRMRYKPQIPKGDWAAIREFVLDAVAVASDGTSVDPDRAVIIAAPFVQWAVNLQGLPLEASAVFNTRTIEAYCDASQLAAGSVATYRSILRAIANQVAPGENPEPTRAIPRRNIQDPYVDAELKRFRAWAGGQSTAIRSRRAKLLLSAGAGAGLRPYEILAVRPTDVTAGESGVTIQVHGTSPRRVTLLAEWESMFLDAMSGIDSLASIWGNSSTVSGNKNQITNFTEHCTGFAPTPTRLRAHWIVTLLDNHVHISVIFEASGFKQFHNLHEYVRFTRRPGTQDARAQLRGGRS
jgi:hypothetical protein